MFETHEANEVMEKTLWQAYVLAFAIGCFVTFLLFYFFLLPNARRSAAESAEKAAQQKFSADLARNPVAAQLTSAKATLTSVISDRDQCRARFNRQTILYDNTIPVDPGKIVVIPADVEPIAVGDHRVTYTHYDPKTKQETAHFYPRRP